MPLPSFCDDYYVDFTDFRTLFDASKSICPFLHSCREGQQETATSRNALFQNISLQLKLLRQFLKNLLSIKVGKRVLPRVTVVKTDWMFVWTHYSHYSPFVSFSRCFPESQLLFLRHEQGFFQVERNSSPAERGRGRRLVEVSTR